MDRAERKGVCSTPDSARIGCLKPARAALLASAAALALGLWPLQPASASEWPEFRGATGQGLSQCRDLPLHWSYGANGSTNIAWTRLIPGQGWSSPILHQNRVFLTTAVSEPSLSLRALCLNAEDGEILWDRELFTPAANAGIHRKNTHASPTPLVARDRLYVHFGHDGTACLSVDGAVLWKNNELSYSPVHGNGGSPVLIGDALVFSCDGGSEAFVAALHRGTGKLLWKTPRNTVVKKSFSFSTPLGIEVNGQKQIISPGSGAVCAYDPKTGREIWRVRYGEGYSVVPRPVYGHGLLFVATGFDRPDFMAIRPDGHGDVTESHVAWTVNRSAPLTPSPLLVGDEVYMIADGGFATCLDARTGSIHWQERIGGKHSASPLHAGGRIYCQSEEGDGIVLQAGKVFKKLAVNPLNERTLASYAADEGTFYIRGESRLFKVRAP